MQLVTHASTAALSSTFTLKWWKHRHLFGSQSTTLLHTLSVTACNCRLRPVCVPLLFVADCRLRCISLADHTCFGAAAPLRDEVILDKVWESISSVCGSCAFAFLRTIAGVAFVIPTLSTTSMYTSTVPFLFFAKPGRKRRLSISVGGSASTPSWMQTATCAVQPKGVRPRPLLASEREENTKIECEMNNIYSLHNLVSKAMSSYLCSFVSLLLIIGFGCPTSGMVDIYRHGDLGFPCWRVPAVALAERYVQLRFASHTCRCVVLDC